MTPLIKDYYDITPEMEAMLCLMINGGRLSITPSVRIVHKGSMHEFSISDYLWLKSAGVMRERPDGKVDIKTIVYADIAQCIRALGIDAGNLLGWALGRVDLAEESGIKEDWQLVKIIANANGYLVEGSPAGFTVV
ncbi:hypothetical protein [Aeromonas rivipollensis]|uniref:hypothetical protein n=1 Tax=Aeromonas rivipollensis TaxID=948519 RepID=UPI0026EFD1F9|nr:hypothetical protein [Aeromonas media]